MCRRQRKLTWNFRTIFQTGFGGEYLLALKSHTSWLFYIYTRGPEHEIHARLQSLGLAYDQDYIPWLPTAGPEAHHHPPPVPCLPSSNRSLLSRGRDQEVVSVPHSDWLSGHCGCSAIRVNLILPFYYIG